MRKDTGFPFRRVLVANRGEIALRVIRACRELGLESVAIFVEEERGLPYVRAADIAVPIGVEVEIPFLLADRVLDAARTAQAEALHPGYGFLSERAAFARAVEAAGLVFVGPQPETLAALGDKVAARRGAREAGVPILPGTLDAVSLEAGVDEAEIRAAAAGIGWPLLVKAAAGGGGRGMRRVDRMEELDAAIATASREASAAFGDGRVYLERLVEGARHVEVQLLGDADGRAVALGERDCSVQRRHQKLVEEAPAPGLSEDERRRLLDLAVRVAHSVGLRNAGTAEFLVRGADAWFLEVNARLQVEHGVTELVADLDLVHEQFRVAAGHPLSGRVRDAAERAVAPARHAIEMRVSAEDPSDDFAPSPGTIAEWREPAGPGVRVDAGVERGSRVGAVHDPLLAKLLVAGPDRQLALARLRRAVPEFLVAGVATTLAFHRWLLDTAEFQQGRADTAFVERSWKPAEHRLAAARRAAALAAAATLASQGAEDGNRWSRNGGPQRPANGWAAAARLEGVHRWPDP